MKRDDAAGANNTPVLVSACLLGAHCTYDERLNSNATVSQLARSRPTIAVCPEELAGLGTPRPASHLTADGSAVLAGQGQVLLDSGEDVSAAFVDAARRVVELCRAHGVKEAYLKSKSPSCGHGPLKINRRPDEGSGVTAAALLAAGIKVISCDADPDVAEASFEV